MHPWCFGRRTGQWKTSGSKNCVVFNSPVRHNASARQLWSILGKSLCTFLMPRGACGAHFVLFSECSLSLKVLPALPLLWGLSCTGVQSRVRHRCDENETKMLSCYLQWNCANITEEVMSNIFVRVQRENAVFRSSTCNNYCITGPSEIRERVLDISLGQRLSFCHHCRKKVSLCRSPWIEDKPFE